MSERGSTYRAFMWGLLLGGAAGYAIAMLYAPRTGRETRAVLNEKSRELRDRAVETVHTTVDKTGKIVTEGRERIGEGIVETRNRMQERVSDLKGRGEAVLSEVRGRVSGNLHKATEQVEQGIDTLASAGDEISAEE